MTRTLFSSLSLLAAFSATPAFAGYYTSGTRGTTTTDEGLAEVYADAIEDYGGSGNLYKCIDGVELFINHMDGAGYSNYAYSTDASAWSTDYEQANSDDTYNDTADFGYFSGHGGSGGFSLHGSQGDDWVDASETRLGNQDQEVLALDACQSLNAAGRTRWINNNRNDGIHWIMGFHSNAIDNTTTADDYGRHLANGYDVDTAWILATMAGHSSGTGAYVRFYNSSCDTYWDDIHSLSCDPTSNASTAEYTWSL